MTTKKTPLQEHFERFDAAECENQYPPDCECEICLALLEIDPTTYIPSDFRRDSIENLPIPSGPSMPIELKIEISPEQLREIQARSDAMADRARTAGRESEVDVTEREQMEALFEDELHELLKTEDTIEFNGCASSTNWWDLNYQSGRLDKLAGLIGAERASQLRDKMMAAYWDGSLAERNAGPEPPEDLLLF
ncbi:MAG: hypothetical protein IT422_22575 [Pirellulaceae bacterium]|nr:hypothetical protein [Pirellulaceae bacterium]